MKILNVKEEDLVKTPDYIQVEIIEYYPDVVLKRTIVERAASGLKTVEEELKPAISIRISPFDVFLQVVEGSAEVVVNGMASLVKKGESITVLAHSRMSISSTESFKLVSTVVKKGYESIV